MKITDLLKKVANGEDLTDEEKAFLSEYNPDSSIAAARKKAEEKQAEAEKRVKDLETKISDLEGQIKQAGDSKKSELELLTDTVKGLQKKLDDQSKALEEAETKTKEQARSAKINKLLSGVKLVDGVDRDMVSDAFARKFSEISDEDLDNADVTGSLLETWKGSNAAIVADDSGHGSGAPPKGSDRGAPTYTGNPYAEKTFNLTEQIELEKTNPQRAERLKAEAAK